MNHESLTGNFSLTYSCRPLHKGMVQKRGEREGKERRGEGGEGGERRGRKRRGRGGGEGGGGRIGDANQHLSLELG